MQRGSPYSLSLRNLATSVRMHASGIDLLGADVKVKRIPNKYNSYYGLSKRT